MKKRFLVPILAIIFSFILVMVSLSGQATDEILWDQWGIAHIYGKNQKSLFYGFGWAQAQSHGNLLLKLYGQARGKAAEYWGVSYLASDQYVWTMGIPERAEQWYQEQSAELNDPNAWR